MMQRIAVLLLATGLWAGCQSVSAAGATSDTSTGSTTGTTSAVSGSGVGTTSGGASASSTGTSTGPASSTGGSTTGLPATSTGTSGGGATTGWAQPVETLVSGGSPFSGCELPDAGLLAPNGIAAAQAGGFYMATDGLDFIGLDGGIGVVFTAAAAEAMLGARGAGGPGAQGVAVSGNGNVYATNGLQIFQVVGSGATFLAGNGIAGNCDNSDGDAGAGFVSPEFMAADPQGNVYVTDDDSGFVDNPHCTRIRKVTPDGTVTTLAGVGQRGFQDGPGATALFNYPTGIAVDATGHLYVADGNDRIRKIDPDGTVSTLAGNGKTGFDDGTGGPNGTATFNGPEGVAVDSSGNVFVADVGNASIREIAPDGTTTTVAGNGTEGVVDGTLGRDGTTQFIAPSTIAVDGLGNIYVGDYASCSVRVIHLGQ